jgi:hypothetical protein
MIWVTIMESKIKIGNIIHKKCCKEIGSLFFFLTTEPHELKPKKPMKLILFFTRCLVLLKHSSASYRKVMLMACLYK